MKNKNYPYYEHKDLDNLLELIEYNYKRKQNDKAFEFYDNNKVLVSKTYSDFYSDVINLSNYLNSKFKNRHIAIIGENSYEWITLFFAIILSGNVVVAIDKEETKDNINHLLKNSDTKIAFYSVNYCEFLEDNKKLNLFKIQNISELIDEGKTLKNKAKTKKNDPAVIYFTSGTTGPNKGVVLSQRNITSDIYNALSIFDLNGKCVSVLPYHHAFGLITSVLKPFYYGVPVFINNSLKQLMDDFKVAKPNTLFVVPMFVETFYKSIWRTVRKKGKEKTLKRGIKLSNTLLKLGIDKRRSLFKDIHESFGGNLENIVCGGAYLDKKYIKWFRSIGINIYNGYGITECSPVVSVNRNNYYKDGSIGQICKNEDVKIIDGEICVKGDNVMLGYYKDKKATNMVIKDDYFHTGDLGYIDNDGFLFITGRKKNLIILSNGENISPEAIEEVLYADKGVCEVVVYAVSGRIIAEIYPTEEYISDGDYFDELINNYNKGLPTNKKIALVKLRTVEFEKNNNKKILRNKVVQEL